jgi:hypothetical protein
MTSLSAKALLTDQQGLAFLRAVLRRSPGSPAPLQRIVHALVERGPALPDKDAPTADRLAEIDS